MQYHALSLADSANLHVDIVAYPGAKPLERLLHHERVNFFLVSPVRWRLPKSLFIVYAPLKVLYQVFQLLWTLLFVIKSPDFILVQNPPAIPVLMLARVVSNIRGANLVIDWHNFGYSLLALAHSEKHPLVRISLWYERVFGFGAAGNLCVTKAMSKFLKEDWDVDARVLYDRPPSFFRRITVEEQHDLFTHLETDRKDIRGLVTPFETETVSSSPSSSFADWNCPPSIPHTAYTMFTYRDNNGTHLRADRPAIVVSSTSWTPDEDFAILLDAILQCEAKGAALAAKEQKSRDLLASPAKRTRSVLRKTPTNKNSGSSLPKILFIITGKGPMKAFYEKKIAAMSLKYTRVCTAWLRIEDYPRLLGCSDLGVSLHTSSSGLDLPMKVVDMFGCCLPVCAIDFECLHELVQHGENGLTFNDSNQLASQILGLLENFGADGDKDDGDDDKPSLARMRQAIVSKFGNSRWDENWNKCALPYFK